MNLQQQRELLKRKLLEDRRKTNQAVTRLIGEERRAPLRNAKITDWINRFEQARNQPPKRILSCSSSVCHPSIRSKRSSL